jgi:hypothetical protein
MKRNGSVYVGAFVRRSAIEQALPPGEDYTRWTFEMRLFCNDEVLCNAATTIDVNDIRVPKAIVGVVIAMRDMTVTRVALYYFETLVGEHEERFNVKDGQRVVVDWSLYTGDNPPKRPPSGPAIFVN